VVDVEPVFGANARGGIGYHTGAIDLRLRLDAGILGSTHSLYVPVSLSAEAVLASF
jgi:hypothetical protein